VWYLYGERGKLPPHPAALLGTTFHGVMDVANRGELTGTFEERRAAAREIFDLLAADGHAHTHPLLKMKFPTPERLPYFNQQRELAALLSAEVDAPSAEATHPGHAGSGGSEKWFESSDGKIVGRPDLLDREHQEVIDYKTGLVANRLAGVVSDRERRQLNLYAYLAHEAGIDVDRGSIIRANGKQASIDISADHANEEAARARGALTNYNAAIVGATFEDLAQPAPDVCAMCDCLPLCGPFWTAAEPSWLEECGVHVHGAVLEVEEGNVQDTALVTMKVEASSGTVDAETVTIEQVPLSWFTADGDRGPQLGDHVRIVNGCLASSEEPIRIRADRTMTAVWRVAQAEHEAESDLTESGGIGADPGISPG
jgi:hypothetical protein